MYVYVYICIYMCDLPYETINSKNTRFTKNLNP